MNLNIKPLTPAEHKYSYSQSSKLTALTGCIGNYIDGVDPDNPREFIWTDCREDLKTADFQADFAAVLNELRHSEDCGCILAGPEETYGYCRAHPESAMSCLRCEYGFRVDTEKYAYILRLTYCRIKGEPRTYSTVIFCFDRSLLDGFTPQAENGIRFFTPGGKEKFRLQDGDEILITLPDNQQEWYICRYIDSQHFETDNYKHQKTYHVRQFTKLIERAGGVITPLRANLPEKCYVADRLNKRIIILQRGALNLSYAGAYPKDVTLQEAADQLNKQDHVSKAQAAAMAAGVLYGWDSPMADPACYDEHGHMLAIQVNR